MHRKQAIALALVGIWIGWTLFMWFAATRSFRTASRVFQNPGPQFEQVLRPLSGSSALTVLRHFAGEVNATYFRAYGLAQIVLGVIIVLLLSWQTPRDAAGLALAGVMLALVLILALWIAPQIASLGRSLDFSPSSAQASHFWMLHGAYTGLDSVKLLAGIVLAVRWILMA